MTDTTSSIADAIGNASALNFGLIVAHGNLITMGSSWGSSAMLIRKRILHDTPNALVRSAAQGYIELQGTAELMAGDPIYAPLSNRLCTWSRYRVEEKHRRHSGSGSKIEWRTVNRGTSDSLFYPVDTTGRCAVDPEGAQEVDKKRSQVAVAPPVDVLGCSARIAQPLYPRG